MSSAPNHGHPITTPGCPRDPPDAAARRRRRDVTCPQAVCLAGRPVWGQVNGPHWALGSTGRVMYPYMTTPTNTDPIDSLGRREQSIIFRLRSQHVCLNMHLNKINPMQEPVCPLCPCAYETVSHFLFECPELLQLRKTYLPANPDLGNTLYSDHQQLNNTAKYFIMANRQRNKFQDQAGSA